MEDKSPSQHPRPARVGRRRSRTREALLAAGRTLFAQRDVDAVSIDEIVNLAEVAKGSFYNHFEDKEAFAREIGAEVRNRIEDLIIKATTGVTDPAQHVALGMCVFAHFANTSRDGARVLYKLNDGSTMVEAPINRRVCDVVRRGLEANRFRDVDVQFGVLLVMGQTVITVRHMLEERRVAPPVEVARLMAQTMLRALGVPLAEARRLSTRAARQVFGEADSEGLRPASIDRGEHTRQLGS